ncbi:MAG TPA: HAD family hydrolase [Planctomycetota bacterium]
MKLPYDAVTFDCFGTLVDWKLGQERVLEQFPSLRGQESSIGALIEARGVAERELESGPWMPYQEVLAESIGLACERVLEVELTPAEKRAFAAGQLGWPTFPDSQPALARLAAAVPIGLLSNCDAQTLRLAAHKHFRGVPVALFVSSEEVRSYKPAHSHWGAALAALGMPAERVLHVSFTREYDLDSAHQLGFSLGFVARYKTAQPVDLPIAVAAADVAGLVQKILTPA